MTKDTALADASKICVKMLYNSERVEASTNREQGEKEPVSPSVHGLSCSATSHLAGDKAADSL